MDRKKSNEVKQTCENNEHEQMSAHLQKQLNHIEEDQVEDEAERLKISKAKVHLKNILHQYFKKYEKFQTKNLPENHKK